MTEVELRWAEEITAAVRLLLANAGPAALGAALDLRETLLDLRREHEREATEAAR